MGVTETGGPGPIPATAPTLDLPAALIALPDPVAILGAVRDPAGAVVELRFRFLNEASARLVGRPAAPLIGRGLLEVFPAVRERGAFDALVGALTATEPVSFEVPRIRGSQVESVFFLTATAFDDGVLVSARDVTAQRRAEEAVVDAGRRYRLLAESAADFVAETASDGQITWVSPAVTRTLGWAPAELIGTAVADLVHPEDQAAAAALRDAPDAGDPFTAPSGGVALRMRIKGAGWRWMSGSSTPILDESGAPVGVVASLKDVDELVRAREAAQADRAHLRATVDSLLDPHILLAAIRDEAGQIVDFVYVDANPAACAYNRLEYTELVGSRLLSIFVGHAGTDLLQSYRGVVESGEPLQVDDVGYVHEILGTERRYDIRAARVGDGLSLTWRDVTDRSAAAEALARSEERYRLLAENASDVVLQLTPSGTFEWVSEAVTDILGWRPTDVVGSEIAAFLHPEDQVRFRQVWADTAPGSTASVEIRFRCADGSYRWVACRLRLKRTPDGVPMAVVGGLVDVADRKAAEEKLSFSASHDPLTGLANRAMLLEETGRALAAGQRSGRATALLLLDLDHFKNVNDAMGHTVGDELLRAVAERITRSVRAVDLVARHGGDEFVVLQRDLGDPGAAQRLAERLVTGARKPLVVGDTELFATASVGVAVTIPGVDPVREAGDLIREADTAMYAAKVAGRDRVAQFNEDLRRTVDARLRIESELRHALARDELAVWYQPEIDLTDGTVRAAEALLRWHHPDGNLRVAGEFIDVAEDSGLILDIGAWVLGQSCAEAAHWAADPQRRRPVLRVNLSALQLSEPGMLDILDAALDTSGLDPDLLCMEITETAVLSHSATVEANLHGIRDRGVDLAIDDFGTGYGSLSYLRRYPIDLMKIDRSFVGGIATDLNDRRLVAGVVALAERLGIAVTAEGVETAAQERVLAAIGCAGAQGFLYAPALPGPGLEEFMRGHTGSRV
ncbi:sensor domain-containing protein [Pengzhenrongella frigida]|uniref:EAL domain-containing protein n=1 Tax=Pengzhenrongella frigida TaxID=1259133 RepID=A0A4Q5MXS6_9MICO|nr:EAL domain-containing protein [Cellulomonas sp. HLT2-17]RYV50435.1 EAL domain-containing protein [Cellulomonas sp. HLT2-17]